MAPMTPHDRTQFIKDVAEAINSATTTTPLSDDERRWVRLAIKREAQSVAFRQAIIDKALSALALAAMGWVGFAVMAAIKSWLSSKPS